MRVITTEKAIYTFQELPDDIKEIAIQRFYSCDMPCLEFVTDDFKAILAILGFESVNVQWSGFWSQGDGASFSARWKYRKGFTAELKAYAPQDQKLHGVAAELRKLARRFFYDVEIEITTARNRYCHENTMVVSSAIRDGRYIDLGNFESEFLDQFRNLARWYYRTLESEYEYQMSIEAFAELCGVNSYEFDSSGVLQ